MMEERENLDVGEKILSVKALARKVLMEPDASRGFIVEYVKKGIVAIKKLREIYYGNRDDDSVSTEEKKEIKGLIIKLIRHLSSINFDVADERAQRYAQMLNHYRFVELADDKSLIAEFEKARQDYKDHPNDGHACNRFGWVLHDCLRASYGRLKNVKLTQFFLKEFETWTYSGAPKQRNLTLAVWREQDIEEAKTFLDGIGDALLYSQQGEWKNALRAVEIYLKRHPDAENTQAYEIIKDACWHLLREDAAALMSLLNDGVEVFGALEKKSARYSYVLSMATTAITRVLKDSKTVWPNRFKNGGRSSDSDVEKSAAQYIAFVKNWGIGNFIEGDRDDGYKIYRHRLSLVGRVVLALLRCAIKAKVDVASSENWILSFAESERGLFDRNPDDYLFRMADVLYRQGDLEKSRLYALDLVRENQSEGWRWRVLGRTYPKDARERADCFSRATSQARVIENARRVGFLNKLFDPKHRPTEIEADFDDAPFVAEKAMQDGRAEALLVEGAKQCDGVVLSCVKDKRDSEKTSMRVWWRSDDGCECTDFVSLNMLGSDIDLSKVGAPIVLFMVKVGEREKVVKVQSRPQGRCLDIYPYRTGVVVERNDSRHVLNVMYAEGSSCPVNIKKLDDGVAFALGDACLIALLEREGMAPLVLDVKPALTDMGSLPFVKEFKGVLVREKGRRDAHVGKVVVPSGAYSRDMVYSYVEGVAVAFHDGDGGRRLWRAITCKTISEDLEVPVVGGLDRKCSRQ